MLSIRDVQVSFGGYKALRGVSADAAPGRILGLVGPNGSGKSTLLNVVAGVILPDGGGVTLAGRALPLGQPERVAMAGIARTFQVPRLARRLTVAQNMIVGDRHHPGESLVALVFSPAAVRRHERAVTANAFAILRRLGLDHLADRPAGTLSGGQQKLLSMGVALMADPAVILLDEPAAGVNPVMIRQQVQFLQSLRDEGRIVVLIEHNMEMVADLCDEVVVLDAGEVIARGTPAEIRRDREVMRSYLGEVV
jgi:ABC-type branched-subunit amino acid transport system ATPase component